MPTPFDIKRVLDCMNRLGTKHRGVKAVSEAAASELGLAINSPEVRLAALYAQYEILCLSLQRKPVSLGTWMSRSPRRDQHA